jgi:hypothetical protein
LKRSAFDYRTWLAAAVLASACTMPNPKFGATAGGDGTGEEGTGESGEDTDSETGDGTSTTGPTTDTDSDSNTDTSTTDPADCGNGMIDPGETCDTDALPNGECEQCQIVCQESFENCNQNPEDGCEVDLLSAAGSCGYCGHDCLGGECKDGVCLPVQLGEGQKSPYDIAVDGTEVYWTNRTGGTVMHVDKTGKALPNAIAQEQNGPTGVTAHGGTVFWTNFYAGEVMSGGVGDDPTPFAKGQYGPFMIATDGAAVYWTNFDGGTVQVQPINGQATTSIAVQQGTPRYIDVSPSQVVWSTSLAEGSIHAFVKGDNQSVVLATGRGADMGGVDADDAWVYFAATLPGAVAKVPADGGEVTVIAEGEPKPKEVAFDTDHVYWTNSDAGEVMARVRAGGEPWTLATSPGSPWAIAEDDVAVYWTDLSDGSVWKVAKP